MESRLQAEESEGTSGAQRLKRTPTSESRLRRHRQSKTHTNWRPVKGAGGVENVGRLTADRGRHRGKMKTRATCRATPEQRRTGLDLPREKTSGTKCRAQSADREQESPRKSNGSCRRRSAEGRGDFAYAMQPTSAHALGFFHLRPARPKRAPWVSPHEAGKGAADRRDWAGRGRPNPACPP